jgi:hypothetical protein
MNSNELDEKKNTAKIGASASDKPKYKKLIEMVTFRVVPAYFKEIEKVAKNKNVSVSKLIRTYIKEGMKRDGELTDKEEKSFNVE